MNELNLPKTLSNAIIVRCIKKAQVAGTAVISPNNDVMEIVHLKVIPERQEEGIGTELLTICEDYAWIKNYNEILALTPFEAFEYFESIGYVYDSELKLPNGDSLFKMRKSLTSRYTEHSNFLTELSKKELYQLMIAECPDYESRFLLFDDKGLLYSFANDFAHYIFELYRTQNDDAFRRAIRIVHTLVIHSDQKISELGIIGILEDLQNITLREKINEGELIKSLTHETRLYWDSLNKFWNKEIPCVGADVPRKKAKS
jgi:N-acetylglutamate synthase-like GNAT family acetyltransferase